jgi:uncharacterized membrane protein (UPF0127 family)
MVESAAGPRRLVRLHGTAGRASDFNSAGRMAAKSGGGRLDRLVCDGDVVASIEVAKGAVARMRGLLGRDGIDGALLLPRDNAVHTFGMRFAVDVAFLNRQGRVIDAITMTPRRLCRPRFRARAALEAEAGAFARWGLARGSRVEIHSVEEDR